jgi:hypothetical protein
MQHVLHELSSKRQIDIGAIDARVQEFFLPRVSYLTSLWVIHEANFGNGGCKGHPSGEIRSRSNTLLAQRRPGERRSQVMADQLIVDGIWFVSTVILFIVAWQNFNEPPTNRSSTTFLLFLFGVTVY